MSLHAPEHSVPQVLWRILVSDPHLSFKAMTDDAATRLSDLVARDDAAVPLVRPTRDVFTEAADLSVPELERRILTLSGQIASAEAELLVYLGAFDTANGWAGRASFADWLSWWTGMSITTARERVRIARALRELPVTREAMLAGLLSYSKVRAITRVASPATEADLVQLARGCSAEQLDRIVGALVPALSREKAQERRAKMSLHTHWDADGNLVGTFCLPAEDGAALLSAVERLMPDPITPGRTAPDAPAGASDGSGEEVADTAVDEAIAAHDRYDIGAEFARSRAAGLVEVARRSLTVTAGDGPAPTSTEVVVHVDAASVDHAVRRRLAQTGQIVQRPHEHADAPAGASEQPGAASELAVGWVEDGPALCLETVERLLCDASVRTRCGHEHPDAPEPRASRTPSAAQKRRLWRRDHGCRAPGCRRKRGLHAHHIIPWSQGGPTKLRNLVLLCEEHHHLVHEGGWTLTVRNDHVVLTSPDGTKTCVEAPRTEGSAPTLVATRPYPIVTTTQTSQQYTDGFNLGYSVDVVATNIELLEARAASNTSPAGASAQEAPTR